jgi:hypothetical protein
MARQLPTARGPSCLLRGMNTPLKCMLSFQFNNVLLLRFNLQSTDIPGCQPRRSYAWYSGSVTNLSIGVS